MKIDLHVHCNNRSACGQVPQEAQIQAGIDNGLDAIAFADHHRLVPPAELVDLNRKYAPFKIFSAIEITVAEEEDIIVVGVDDPKLELMERQWRYLDLHAFVNLKNGIMCLAHPFRYHEGILIDIETYRPHGIEKYSWNTAPVQQSRISEIAHRHGLFTMSNSDAHGTRGIGQYFNDVDGNPADGLELAALLKAGKFKPVCLRDSA